MKFFLHTTIWGLLLTLCLGESRAMASLVNRLLTTVIAEKVEEDTAPRDERDEEHEASAKVSTSPHRRSSSRLLPVVSVTPCRQLLSAGSRCASRPARSFPSSELARRNGVGSHLRC